MPRCGLLDCGSRASPATARGHGRGLGQRERRPRARYPNGPNGWTTNDAAHSSFGPRTACEGRRFRSRTAIAVRTNSIAPPTRIVDFCAGVRSAQDFFSLMAPTLCRPTPMGTSTLMPLSGALSCRCDVDPGDRKALRRRAVPSLSPCWVSIATRLPNELSASASSLTPFPHPSMASRRTSTSTGQHPSSLPGGGSSPSQPEHRRYTHSHDAVRCTRMPMGVSTKSPRCHTR